MSNLCFYLNQDTLIWNAVVTHKSGSGHPIYWSENGTGLTQRIHPLSEKCIESEKVILCHFLEKKV